jgi:hypothetical protein
MIIVKTGDGPLLAGVALERFKSRISGNNYSFLISTLRNLPDPYRAVAAQLVAANKLKRPLHYCRPPASILYREATQKKAKVKILVTPEQYGYKLISFHNYAARTHLRSQHDFDFDGASRTLVVLRNDGKHLYGARHEQEDPSHFLRFRQYRGCGANFGSVHLQHLGHLYGVHGGLATVIVHTRNLKWTLECHSGRHYCIVDHRGTEYLYMSY